MNCVGYVRVSTERQAGEVFTSLADQEKAIRQRAARLELEVGRWFRDEGASGATADKRPAFRELLDYCEAHPRPDADGVILVLNDSRFGRFPDPEEAAYWRHHLRRLGWIVRFCEGDDTEDTTARTVLRAIGSAQATEYRENIRRNARRGMRGAAAQGFWTREAPYGYRRQVAYPELGRVLDVGELKTDREKVKLTPHDEEAANVRWAFEAFAAGRESVVSLAPEFRKRAPRLKWTHVHIGRMLRSPVYCGDVPGGLEDAHPPIVPRPLWEEVQRKLSLNPSRPPSTDYLLTGLMQCPHCERAYTGGGGGKGRKFYKDPGGVDGVCPGRIGTVMRHIVDDATIDTLAETIGSPAVQQRIERELDRALVAAGGAGDSEAQIKVARRRALEKQERLIALLADGTLLRDEAAPQLETIRAELAELDARRDRLRFEARRADASSEARDRILALARDFSGTARRLREHGHGKALRRLVEPWLEGATFDKHSRELVLSIRPVPFLAESRPGPTFGQKVTCLVRRISLAQDFSAIGRRGAAARWGRKAG